MCVFVEEWQRSSKVTTGRAIEMFDVIPHSGKLRKCYVESGVYSCLYLCVSMFYFVDICVGCQPFPSSLRWVFFLSCF